MGRNRGASASSAVAIAALALCGCASDRLSVRPVTMGEAKRVCIIENPRVRAEFLTLYRKVLEEKGYATRVVSASSSLGVCPVASRYVAYWNWDLVPYMSSAELSVYREGLPAGRGIITGKYTDTEEKIRKLVRDLYR